MKGTPSQPTRRRCRRTWSVLVVFACAWASVGGDTGRGQDKNWEGVDKTVIEKVARDAGRPAREPYLNTDQGDLLLTLFLLAGTLGGFVAGYTFRSLFPPAAPTAQRSNSEPDQDHAPLA